jgi:hypothetical protein
LSGFLRAHATAALAGLALAAACLALAGTWSPGWLLLGHVPALAAGMVSGGWLVARHGEPMARFLPALLVGMATRMLLVLASAVPLTTGGLPAFVSYLCGLAAAVIPMQVHEAHRLRQSAGATAWPA